GAAAGDAALVADLWHAAAKVLETRLEEARPALEAYRKVVAITADGEAGASAVRVAGRLGEWNIAAEALVDVGCAKGSAPAEGLASFDEEASRSNAWVAATKALSESLAVGRATGPAGRDLYARLATWHRDRRADTEAAQVAFRKALELDPTNAPLLRELAELERRDRGRLLVET